MAISLTATPAASLSTGSGNQFIFAVLDPVGRNVVYGQVAYAAGTPTTVGAASLAVPSAAAGAALPSMSSVSVVSAGPDGAGNLDAGIVTVTLTPAAGDTVNASSPQILHLSPQAIVLTNATAS